MTLKMWSTLILSYAILFVCKTKGSEPTCSRFHYEEKTLEKMIRQEILVEKMKMEIEDSKQEVKAALESLIQERMTIGSLKKSVNAYLEDTRSQQESILKDFNAEIKRLRDSTTPSIVGFNARSVADKLMSDGKIVVFTDILFNSGDGYDKETGIFQAPLEGVYFFSTQICLTIGKRSYYAIFVNEQVISSALYGDANYEKCYTLNAITKLNKDDTVSVKCIDSCSGDSVWEYTKAINSFLGTLVIAFK